MSYFHQTQGTAEMECTDFLNTHEDDSPKPLSHIQTTTFLNFLSNKWTGHMHTCKIKIKINECIQSWNLPCMERDGCLDWQTDQPVPTKVASG